MSKKMKRILLILVVLVLTLAACNSGPKMSEEEIRDACFREVENFVGGYLSNSSANFLKKYDSDPEYELRRNKLAFNYDFYTNSEVAEMVCDYIIEHASFEIDRYSFYLNKDTDKAELAVNVTIIPPEAAKSQLEDIFKNTFAGDEAKKMELYNQAISIINSIQPVTASIPVKLYYEDGEWLIDSYWMIMIYINEAS